MTPQSSRRAPSTARGPATDRAAAAARARSGGTSLELARRSPIRARVAMSFREDGDPALVDHWHAMLRAARRAVAGFELARCIPGSLCSQCPAVPLPPGSSPPAGRGVRAEAGARAARQPAGAVHSVPQSGSVPTVLPYVLVERNELVFQYVAPSGNNFFPPATATYMRGILL